MKINKNNYESYFVDYLEGNLDEKMVDDFIEFLQQHPELKNELSFFDSVSIVPEEIEFSKKENLYKEKYDIGKAFDKAAIERLEGEISEEENKNFKKYLTSHPEKEKEAALFNHTILKPDESIVFRKKRKLYHYSAGRTVLLWSARIAAILVLALIFYVLADHRSDNFSTENQVASAEKENTKKDVNPVVEQTKTENTIQNQDKTKKEKEPTETTSPAVKKPVPQTREPKSLRETTKGRLEDENLTLHRIPVEVPVEMSRITASLNMNTPMTKLATMNFQPIERPVYDERLLADVVKEKTGIDKLSFNKIKKAGLNLVSTITKDNLSYETNKKGEITEINYDSRLMAFSIPTHKEEKGN